MKDLLEISCGLDVHKDKIVACILSGPIGKTTVSEIREFTTLIPDMAALRDWIVSCNCHHVAMESTGIYWQPIYEILEDAYSGDITLLVVNARHMKNVPGKKTDMRDSEWIATLLRAGLLNGSFIPDKQIREFRYLNRYRKSIIRDITSQKNRVEKFLQSSGFRLSTFISDIFGASGRNIICHLIQHGCIDRESLDSCLKTKTRNHINEILVAVNGTLSQIQQDFLEMLMDHYDSLKSHLAEIETALEEAMAPFSLHIEQLTSIYGINTTASCAIIAEIGTDMSYFKTAEHICSWAGLCPKNNESAGKKKRSGIKSGNNWLRSMLCECAWSATKKKDSRFKNKYWSMVPRMGRKKALIAIANMMLRLIYHLLKTKSTYKELEIQYFIDKDKRREDRIIKELKSKGYLVEKDSL